MESFQSNYKMKQKQITIKNLQQADAIIVNVTNSSYIRQENVLITAITIVKQFP